jgi:hypothetical protein
MGLFSRRREAPQEPAQGTIDIQFPQPVQEAPSGAVGPVRPRPTETDLTPNDWALLHILKDAHCAPDSYVVLPSGLVLRADGLHWTTEE